MARFVVPDGGKRFTVAFVAVSGLIIGPACQAIVGIGDRVEAAPDGDAGVGESGPTPTDAGDGGPCADPSNCPAPDAAPSKNCPAGCLPAAPAGWTGPSATYDGADDVKPTDCPATYTNKVLSAHGGTVTGAPATCDCGPATITGRFCTAAVETWKNPGCPSLGTLQGDATSVSCFEFPDMGLSYKVGTATLTPGTCNFKAPVFSTTPEQLEKAHVACGLAQASACATNDQCITTPAPASPFTRLCIHKDGDEPCPSLDYQARFVAHKGIADTRACSPCTAVAATGGACGSNFGTRSNGLQCTALPPTDKTVNVCYDHPGMGKAVDLGAMGPSTPTCTSPGGKPTGKVEYIDPVTFCCNK